jgi:S1-C subfamily serine protease
LAKAEFQEKQGNLFGEYVAMRYAKQKLVFGLILLLGFCGRNLLQAAEQIDISKSVVMIRSASQSFSYTTPWKQVSMTQGIGTGFIIAGKRILTNAHNVSNARYIEVKMENIAKRYPCKAAFIGHDCDLATLAVDDESFFDGSVPLELGDIPEINTTVSTYGFPMGGSRISVTQGVVSRIDVDTYVHTGADSHLVIQTDAAINPGNSGGPVIQSGKVVGVAFQGLRQAENIGYLIPTTVIRHFLADINDGKYDGFGSLGVGLYLGLHSAAYKDYLKVPTGQEGIVVTSVMMHSSVESLLQPGDVVTKIDDCNIDNDGKIRIYGLTLDLGEAIEAKQIGQTVEVTFYRQGKLMKKTAKVALNKPVLEYARQYDIAPRYVCFAGLVFVPITRNYLETWGRDWLTDIPFYLRYLFYDSVHLNTERQRKEYVVLSEVMPDQLNSYAGEFKHKPVESINDTPIYKLDDVFEALKKPSGNCHIIKFMDYNEPLIIDAQQAATEGARILNKYNIPADSRLEVK